MDPSGQQPNGFTSEDLDCSLDSALGHETDNSLSLGQPQVLCKMKWLIYKPSLLSSSSKSKILESMSPNVSNEDNDNLLFIATNIPPGTFSVHNFPKGLYLVQRSLHLPQTRRQHPMRFIFN